MYIRPSWPVLILAVLKGSIFRDEVICKVDSVGIDDDDDDDEVDEEENT
jgi:hypothetical protein